MNDLILILGLLVGVIVLLISKKMKNNRVIKNIGIIIIVVCAVMSMPDIIKGFMNGFNEVWNK